MDGPEKWACKHGVGVPRPAGKLLFQVTEHFSGHLVVEEGCPDDVEAAASKVKASQQMECTALEMLVFVPVISM